jgi:nitroreductase
MLIGAGAGIVAAAGLGYRIWDRGVFAAPSGEPYAPWDHWQGSIVDGLKRPLHAAILAANPHDTQPWLFEINASDSITVYADRIRNLGSFDPFRREMHLGLGCAIENLVRAAQVYGYTPYVRPVPGRLTLSPPDEPKPIAHITLDPGQPSRDALFEAIPTRHTNRGVYLDKPVQGGVLQNLADLTAGPNVQTVFLAGASERRDLAGLIVDATQRIIADPTMSADSARWIRTGRREVEDHRDGISIDNAGLSPATVMLGKLMPDLGAATQDSYWLDNTRTTQVHAPVLGMILVKDRLDMAQALDAGRAWQRLHLAATALGLAAQPLNQPVECIDRNAQLGRADTYQSELLKLANQTGWQPTFAFRLGYAEKPALPSPRRPLDDVMKSSGYA